MPTSARGANRPTDAVQAWSVSRPSPAHESAVAALEPLALVQRPGGRRVAIKQLKGDSALGAIPTRHFFANETYFHLLLLAYTLVNWFKRLCLPPEFQNATLQTLRHQILFMPAQLRRTDNRPRLVLPSSGMREAARTYALVQIERLKP